MRAEFNKFLTWRSNDLEIKIPISTTTMKVVRYTSGGVFFWQAAIEWLFTFLTIAAIASWVGYWDTGFSSLIMLVGFLTLGIYPRLRFKFFKSEPAGKKISYVGVNITQELIDRYENACMEMDEVMRELDEVESNG